MKKLIKNFFALLNISIRSKSKLDKKLKNSISKDQWKQDIQFTEYFSTYFGKNYLNLLELSKSETRQDLFALKELKMKKNGFFVEFGATNGITNSNTYLLEKEFNYTGILAEPNPKQRQKISEVRNAIIVEKCVWSKSNEKLDFFDIGDSSTIKKFYKKNLLNSSFKVDTISLTDMLDIHNAPSLIDYLSIDTEGSEFEILSSHNFEKYNFSVITVEHNFSENRDKIYELLTKNNYKRVYENLSAQDDWYTFG